MKTFLFGLALFGLLIWRLLSSHHAAPVITNVVSEEQGYDKVLPILFRAEVAFAHRGDGSNINVRHGLRSGVNRALLIMHGLYINGNRDNMPEPGPGHPNYDWRPEDQFTAMDYIDLNAAGARAVGTAHPEALFMAIVQRMPGPRPPKIVWPLYNEELAQLPENKAFYAQFQEPAPAQKAKVSFNKETNTVTIADAETAAKAEVAAVAEPEVVTRRTLEMTEDFGDSGESKPYVMASRGTTHMIRDGQQTFKITAKSPMDALAIYAQQHGQLQAHVPRELMTESR